MPASPVKIARDAAGKPIRDAQGMAVTIADREHPDYLIAVERYHQRVAVLSVVEALQGDSRIRFETAPPENSSVEGWTTYADAIFHEMEQAGFTAGDLIRLCREICRLSNLLGEHLLQAQENFSHRIQEHST